MKDDADDKKPGGRAFAEGGGKLPASLAVHGSGAISVATTVGYGEGSAHRDGVAGTGDSEPPQAAPALFTVMEAAEYLRVSKNYLDKLRVSGGGPVFVRLGRRKVLYRTTGRFLQLFGLESIGELPQAEDLEKR